MLRYRKIGRAMNSRKLETCEEAMIWHEKMKLYLKLEVLISSDLSRMPLVTDLGQ